MQNCIDHRRYVAGCEGCRREARLYQRGLRARNRGLEPETPALTVVDHVPVANVSPEPGAVERGVLADLAALGHVWSEGLAAGALVLARDLDNPRLATSHPSLAKQLAALLDTLRREVAPQGGRLAVVQNMSGERA